MKKIHLIFILIFILYNSAKPQTTKLSSEEKIFISSNIWCQVKRHFPYFDRFHVNYWDSLYVSIIPSVIDTKNDYEFYDIIDDFVNSLFEAHTLMTFNDDYYLNKQQGIDKPDIYVNWLNDGYYVIVVSDSLYPQIPLGSKILSIDNIEVEQYAKKNFSKIVHSKHEHVIRFFSGWFLFNGKKGSKINIKFQKLDGGIFEIELNRDRTKGSSKKFLNQTSFLLEVNRGNFIFNIDSNKICYMNLPGAISLSTIDFFESKMDSIRKCKGLIIDVRSSSGGSSYGDEIVKWISKKPDFQSFAYLTRVDNSYFNALGAYTDSIVLKVVGGMPRYYEYQQYFNNSAFDTLIFTKKREVEHLEISIVVLVNPSVCSATETFLLSFKNSNAGVIIGQPTMGSCTQPLIFPIKNVGFLKIATQKPIHQDGTLFDYIHPDIVINPTINGYIEGKDEILEAAYKYLLKK